MKAGIIKSAGRRSNRALFLLGGRNPLLLPTLYAIHVDHASGRTRSDRLQVCCHWPIAERRVPMFPRHRT
jgi:hypothetical protein